MCGKFVTPGGQILATIAMKRLCLLNTRPKAQNHALTKALSALHVTVIELPMLTIEPIPSNEWLTCPPLTRFKHAIFTSANAVDFFFKHQQKNTWPNTIEIYAIGTATASALNHHGLVVHHIPAHSSSEGLLDLSSLKNIAHQSVLLIKGLKGRTLISDTLTARGAALTELCVYRRGIPSIAADDLNNLRRRDAIDMILYTSIATLQQTFVLFGQDAFSWLRDKPSLVISPRLAKVAEDYGIKTIITTSHDHIVQTIQGLMNDLNQPDP